MTPGARRRAAAAGEQHQRTEYLAAAARITGTADRWAGYLGCPACKAPAGTPCADMTAGGPDALPPRPAARPHSSRPLRRGGTQGARPGRLET